MIGFRLLLFQKSFPPAMNYYKIYRFRYAVFHLTYFVFYFGVKMKIKSQK